MHAGLAGEAGAGGSWPVGLRPPRRAASDGDVAALRSGVGELERRSAALAEHNAKLERENERRRKEIARWRPTVAAGEAPLRDLRAQGGQNSRNPSRPPSSDAPSVPRRKRHRQGLLRQR
jgi:hypothetical protein